MPYTQEALDAYLAASEPQSQAQIEPPESATEAYLRAQRREELEAERRQLEDEQRSNQHLGTRLMTTVGGAGLRALSQVGQAMRDPGAEALRKERYPGQPLPFPQEQLARATEYLRGKAGEYEEAGAELGGGALADIAAGTAGAVVQSLPTMGVALTGNLPLAANVAGIQTYGGMVQQGADNLQRRLPDRFPDTPQGRANAEAQAQAPAAVSGAITSGLTLLMPGGAEKLAGRLGQLVAREGAEAGKQLVNGVIREAAKEIPEELVDQLSQGIVEKVTTDPDKPISEIIFESLFAGGVGGAIGLGVGGLGKAVEKIRPAPEKAEPLAVGEMVSFPDPASGQVAVGVVLNSFDEDGQQVVSLRDQDGNDHIFPASFVRVMPEEVPATEAEVPGTPPESTPEVPPAEAEVPTEPPVAPTEVPAERTQQVNAADLERIANDFIERIEGLGTGAPIATQGKAFRLRQLMEAGPSGKEGRKNYGEMAALLNLKFNPKATQMPQAYRFLGTERTDATAQRQEERQPQHPGDDVGLRPGGEGGPDAPPGQEARAPDSGRRGSQQESALLTNAQRARWTGGALVYLAGQESRGPMEVLETGQKTHKVRELGTGKVFQVKLASARMAAPVSAETPGIRRREFQERRERAIAEQQAAKTKAARAAAEAKLKAIAREEEEASLGGVMHQRVSPSRNAPQRETGKERPGDPGTEGNVAYALPIDNRDHFLARLVAATVEAIRQKLPGSPLRRVVYVKSDPSDPIISVSPSPNGMDTVQLDLDRLVYDTKDMTPRQLADYVKGAMEEEMVHLASGLAIQREWEGAGMEDGTGMTFDQYYDYVHSLLYEDMTPKQRTATAKAYGVEEDDHVKIAEEFVRGVEQKMLDGQVTEEALGDKIVRFLRQWMESINAMVQQIRDGQLRNKLIDHVLAIDKMLRIQEDVQAQSQATTVRRSGRRVGARLITKKEQEAAEFNLPQMSPEQIAATHRSGYAQNQAVLGNATTQWETAPDHVQGRLSKLQQRIDGLERYRGLTGAPENDTRSLEQMVAEAPESERAPLIFDAWESMLDFLRLQATTESQHKEAATKLREAMLDPENSSEKTVKKGVTKLKNSILREAKDKLIKQRREAVAKKRNPAAIDASIKMVEQVRKTHSEAMRRVAAALFQNPDPSALDADAIGISEETLDLLAPLATSMGRARISEITSEPLIPLAKEHQELGDAVQFLEGVMSDSTFKRNLQYVTEQMGAEARFLTESDTEWTIADPYGREDEEGKPIKTTFNFNVESGIDQINRDKAVALLLEIEKYLADPSANPIRAAHYRGQRDRLHFYMDPAFDPGAPKLITREGNIWNLFRKLPGHPEARLSHVGSRMAQLAMQRMRQFDQMEAKVGQVHRESTEEITKKARKAAEKHDLPPDVWSRRILNPILASYNVNGAPYYRVGQKVAGYTILQEDMDAAKVQHAFVSRLITELREMETVQNKAFPVKIADESKVLPIDRYAGATSPMTMPQKIRRETIDFIRAYREANALPADDRRARLHALFSGENSAAFQDAIMGHIRSAHWSDGYAGNVKTPFRELYRTLSIAYDNQTEEAPSSVDDVIDHLFDNQPVKEGAEPKTRSEIEDQLYDEIGRSLRRVDQDAKQYWGANDSSEDVKVIRADNFLTLPRTGTHLPVGLYDYTATTPESQWQITHAPYEVYAQKYVDGLKKVRTELSQYLADLRTKIERSASMLETQGMKPEQARKMAEKAVEKATQKEVLSGREMWDAMQARRILSDIGVSMERMQDLELSAKDFFNEQLWLWPSISAATRGILSQNLLSRPLVSIRNRAGGAVRLMQTKSLMGYAMQPLTISLPQILQDNEAAEAVARTGQSLTQNVVNTTHEIAKLGPAAIKWMLGNGYISKKLLESKAARDYIEKHSDDMGAIMGYLLKFMHSTADEYNRQHRFGFAGSGKFLSRLQNLATLSTTGGKVREETPSAGRVLESALHAVHLLGGLPWLAKSVALTTADQGANIAAANYANEMVSYAKTASMEALSNREDLGVLNRTTLLTPQELTGNPQADDKMAAFNRSMWNRAGIPIDFKMLDYFFRVREARERGESPDSVPFLSNAEYNSLQMFLAEQMNKAGFVNTPETWKKSEAARWLSMLFRYAVDYSHKVGEGRSRVSTQPRGVKSFARGNMQVTMMMAAAMATGWALEPLMRALSSFLYNEERQNKDNLSQESAKDTLKAFMEDAGPFLPIQGGMINSLVNNTVKPGSGMGPQGVSSLPFDLFTDMLGTTREIIQTGNAVDPVMKFAKRYAPEFKVVANRLPMNAGWVNYSNVQKLIRKALPSDIESRSTAPGNIYNKTSISDNKDRILNALAMEGGPEWETVERERDLAIEDLMEKGRTTAAQEIDGAVLQRDVMQRVLGEKPTREVRERILSRMDDEGRDKLFALEQAFREYAGRFNRDYSPYKEEGVKKEQGPVLQAPRRNTPGRSQNPFLNRKERELVFPGR